jgi:hypothetical protein
MDCLKEEYKVGRVLRHLTSGQELRRDIEEAGLGVEEELCDVRW